MKRNYKVERLDQLRALQSPLRLSLVGAMAELGEVSIRELADLLEVQPGRLHHHVKRLLSVGLIEFVGKRKVVRRMESVYRLPGRDLRIDASGRKLAYRLLVGRIYSAAFRLADRTMTRALARPGAVGIEEPSRLIQGSARLRTGKARELWQKIRELETFLKENHDPQAPQSYLFTVAVSEKPGRT